MTDPEHRDRRPTPRDDVIEIEQLLARYAVGMTKDDVDAVVDVFTPDGTYSAFGDTYALADFPTLVAAAPKGLFMVGPPALELDGDDRHRRAAAVLRRPDRPRHAHRLVHRHLPPHRRRVAAAHPVDDVPAQERRARLAAAARPDAGPAHRARLMELDEFRTALDAWLDEHARRAAPPTTSGHGTLDEQMAHLSKVKRLAFDAGWMRWGWPERVGGLGGSTLLRGYLGEALTARGLVEPGIYSMTEVLAPDDDRLRPAGARREMVPRLLRGDETWCQGFSEPGTGSNLGVAVLPRRRRDDDGWRVNGPEGVDEPRPVRPAVRAAHPHRHRRSRRTGASPRCSSTWTRPGITVRPIETMHGRRRVLRGVLRRRRRCPFDRTPRRRGPGLGGRHGPAALRAEHRALAPRRVPAPAARSSLLDARARRRRPCARPRSATRSSTLFALRARSRGHAAPAGRRRAAGAGDVDRQGPAGHRRAGGVRPRRRRARRRGRCSATTRPSERWRTEYLYSRAATIYGGSAEIQRNIVARRLLDLGADR